MKHQTGIEAYYIIKNNQKMRFGYTTGTCAAAAAKAAAQMLLSGEKTDFVVLTTPKGITLNLEVVDCVMAQTFVSCAIVKDAGDDPDVTDGIRIYARVERAETGFHLAGGAGVGRVTRPGLEQAVGEAAINRVPRQMITEALQETAAAYGWQGGLRATISVPEGAERAQKTFNPLLGIEGGISILGTSGIVEPMSEQALVTLGNYGKHYLDELDYMPIRDTIKCSNYIGEVIDMAVNLGAKGLLFIAHIGKFVKVAGGIMNTHSQNADARSEIMAAAALRAGIDRDGAMRILDTVTTAEAVEIVEEAGLLAETMRILTDKIAFYLQHRCYGAIETEALIFSNEKGALGETAGFRDMLAKIEAEAKETKI